MFLEVRDFVVQNVVASYRDFFAAREENRWGESDIVRLGVNAAIALYHLREHIPQHLRPSRQVLEAACPDYDLVGDIANVAKHHEINRNRPRISNADQIYEIKVSTRYEDSGGEYFSSQVEAYVDLDDGSKRNLAQILHAVMDMWCHKLGELGIINMCNSQPSILDESVPREVAAHRQHNIEIMQGEKRYLRMELRQYNYEKGRSEPEDLTDATATFRVFELPKTIPIQIHTSITPEPLDFEIPLTEDQAKDYLRLRRGEDRERFAYAIVERDPDIQSAVVEIIRLALETQRSG